jgi:hypothetical protein
MERNMRHFGRDGKDGNNGRYDMSWAGAGAAVFETGAGHTLVQAALFEKVVLQAEELLVHQIVGLVDETDRDVGDDCRGTGFYELAVVLEGLRGFAAELADISRLLGILVPAGQVAGTEEVQVIIE